MKKLLIILAVIGAIAGFGIYKLVHSFSKAGEVGDAATAKFHSDYNAKRAAAIHADAAPAFRAEEPMEKFEGAIGMFHERLGAWKSGERTGLNMENNNGAKTLELTCSAKWEKGEGTETFLFDYNGDLPLLINYHIKSPVFENPAPAPASVPRGAPRPEAEPEKANAPDTEASPDTESAPAASR